MKKYSRLLLGFAALHHTLCWSSDLPVHFEFIPQFGNTNLIEKIAIHPQGEFMAVADKDFIIKIMDMKHKLVTHVLRQHKNNIIDLKFASNGYRMASIDADGKLIIWSNQYLPEVHFQLEHVNQQTQLAFSNDGLRIYATTDTKINIFDIYAQIQTQQITVADFQLSWIHKVRKLSFTAIDISEDDNWLAVAGNRGAIYLWDLYHRRLHQTIELKNISQLKFKDKLLLAANQQGHVYHWHLQKNTLISHLPSTDQNKKNVIIHPTTDQYALGTKHRLQFRDLKNDQLKSQITLSSDLNPMQFTPDGKRLITVTNKRKNCQAKSAQLVSVATNGLVSPLFQPGIYMHQTPMAISPDGRVLATSACSHNVQLWDIQSASKLNTIAGGFGTVTTIAYSPDGKQLAIGASGGFRIFHTEKKENLADMPVRGFVKSILYNETGNEIAVHSDLITQRDQHRSSHVQLYNSASMQKIHRYQFASGVHTMEFISENQLVLINHAGMVKIFDNASRQLIARLSMHDDAKITGHQLLGLSKANNKLALLTIDQDRQKRLVLWAYKIKKVITSVNIPLATKPVFSPNNTHLLTADKANQIHVFNGNTFEPIQALTRHDTRINQLLFSQDGKIFASASRDGLIRIWHQDGDQYKIKFNLQLLPGDRGISWHPGFPYYFADQDSDRFLLIKIKQQRKHFLRLLPQNRQALRKKNLIQAIQHQPTYSLQLEP